MKDAYSLGGGIILIKKIKYKSLYLLIVTIAAISVGCFGTTIHSKPDNIPSGNNINSLGGTSLTTTSQQDTELKIKSFDEILSINDTEDSVGFLSFYDKLESTKRFIEVNDVHKLIDYKDSKIVYIDNSNGIISFNLKSNRKKTILHPGQYSGLIGIRRNSIYYYNDNKIIKINLDDYSRNTIYENNEYGQKAIIATPVMLESNINFIITAGDGKHSISKIMQVDVHGLEEETLYQSNHIIDSYIAINDSVYYISDFKLYLANRESNHVLKLFDFNDTTFVSSIYWVDGKIYLHTTNSLYVHDVNNSTTNLVSSYDNAVISMLHPLNDNLYFILNEDSTYKICKYDRLNNTFVTYSNTNFSTPLFFTNNSFYALDESTQSTSLYDFDLKLEKFRTISTSSQSNYSVLFKGNEIIYTIQKQTNGSH